MLEKLITFQELSMTNQYKAIKSELQLKGEENYGKKVLHQQIWKKELKIQTSTSIFRTDFKYYQALMLACEKNSQQITLGCFLFILIQLPVILSLLPYFMQLFMPSNCQPFIINQIKPQRKKMSFGYLETYSYFPQVPEINWEQLTQIRDQILGQLISQLSLNRILLDNTINFKSSFENDCSSVPTKNQEQSSEAESEEEVELMDQIKTKKISKHTVSHNSSLRNDTKNIPKNYGKAILSFIQKSPKTKKLLIQMGVSYSDFMMQVRRAKKKINSIEGLKRMWGYDNLDHKIKKCIRILSYEFMRKNCLQYIFHSKVQNYKTHIKYRQKLIEGIENPASFSNIKDY